MNKELRLAILKRFDRQRNFADAVGCTESAVSDVLRGRRMLSEDAAQKWLSVLDCDPSLLVQVIRG